MFAHWNISVRLCACNPNVGVTPVSVLVAYICHVPLWVPVCIHWSVGIRVQPVTTRMAWERVVALWTVALELSSAAIPLVNLKSLIVNGCLL